MEIKLGFGLMRLPKNEAGEIDIPRVCEMADAFLARGFTYFDTAYVYAGSEVAFREAVVRRHPRESFTVASKMAGWQLSETRTPGGDVQRTAGTLRRNIFRLLSAAQFTAVAPCCL